jgi:hypothetical protein
MPLIVFMSLSQSSVSGSLVATFSELPGSPLSTHWSSEDDDGSGAPGFGAGAVGLDPKLGSNDGAVEGVLSELLVLARDGTVSLLSEPLSALSGAFSELSPAHATSTSATPTTRR